MVAKEQIPLSKGIARIVSVLPLAPVIYYYWPQAAYVIIGTASMVLYLLIYLYAWTEPVDYADPENGLDILS